MDRRADRYGPSKKIERSHGLVNRGDAETWRYRVMTDEALEGLFTIYNAQC